MTETYVKEEVAWRTMVKVPLSNSFLERRNARRKFSESLGAGASLAPRTRQRISLGSENDWKFRLRSSQSWNCGVDLELGCCCSDLPVDKQVLDEICRTRKRQFEIPFRLSAASCPRVTSCSIPPGRLSRKRRRTDRKDFYHVPQHHKP